MRSPLPLPETYAGWRRSELGRITDAIEHGLLLDMLGDVRGQRVLDIGCGDGAWANQLADRGGEIIGVDADPRMIEGAHSAKRGNASFLVASEEALAFDDASFDAVTLIAVLCLADHPERILSEAVRVLRPGGRLVIGELGKWSLWALRRRLRGLAGNQRWRKARFHSKSDIERLLGEAGLRVDAVRGAVYYPPALLLARHMAPFDPALSRRLGTLGAAFLAARATRVQ